MGGGPWLSGPCHRLHSGQVRTGILGSLFRVAALLAALTLSLVVWADIPMQDRQSSSVLLSPSNRAMQEDPTLHPASLWLLEGQSWWDQPPVSGQPSCRGCHGAVQSSMQGVAARYPRKSGDRLLNLEARINQCRAQHQAQPAWALESSPLLSLSVLVGHQSKGRPIDDFSAPALAPDLVAGRQLFQQRMGQIHLSCAQCHDQRWGQKLAGVTIPQAHPTGYPLYRLEWQNLGSLQRRLRNCMNAVRAEPYPLGSLELTQLELFLMWRARGMPMETPALRP